MLRLCRVTTADGLHLDGAFQPPDSPSLRRNVALVLIHGTGGNFYSAGILATIAAQAVADGCDVLRINTRGHDLVATIPGNQSSVRGGAAYERVGDAHLDVTAWCDWLAEQGIEQAFVLGHSLGGVKALWSQALAAHPSVQGVIGVSPPRFVHRRFQGDPRCDAFRRDFVLATQHVAEGRAEFLMTVTQPLPLLITAGGYVDKYGPDDPLDYVPMLPQIRCPKLILVGSQSVETNPALESLPSDLEPLAANDPQLTFELIPGADLNYRNDPAEPWRRIRGWIERRTT